MLARALTVLIIAYRGAAANRRPACRFTPSCSEYAEEALSQFGVRRGLPLILGRLVRCRPGGPFGFDPLPEGPLSAPAATTTTEGPPGPPQPAGRGDLR